jgi:LL-diaminopimelate aminotransferase
LSLKPLKIRKKKRKNRGIKKMKVQYSQKIQQLPPYLFAEIDKIKENMLAKGEDIIDLSVGDPDLPTPKFIVDKMKDAVEDSKNHKYPFGPGMAQFREAVSKWYKDRFNVTLDPSTEVHALIGSKEGIAHIPFAFVNNGDVVLVPDPGYPVYNASTILAGGRPYEMPLLSENDFLPDFDSIPHEVKKSAKLMFVNYPNNPTAAVADELFYKKCIKFASENNIIVCHDAAYSDVTFEGYKAPSFMQFPGAKDVGVEFHSLSKTFNMTGWRIGFVVGNKDVIKGLSMVKSNIDSGAFRAIQYAATVALEKGPMHFAEQDKIMHERREILVDGLNKLGWKVEKPKATFYVWVQIPPGKTSKETAMWFLEKTKIIVTPGNGFGKYGEGYIRFSLTSPTTRIKEALERLYKCWHT